MPRLPAFPRLRAAWTFYRDNQVTFRRLFMAATLWWLAAYGPGCWWQTFPTRRLDVVVVDKTVPFQAYREHQNIHWLLHTWKLVGPTGRFLEAARDYVGFDPLEKKGHDLTADRLKKADVVFIADTYGVYTGDYEFEGQVAAMERSPKIYGGLTSTEALAIEQLAKRGGLVVAEFNTFASPTEPEPQQRMEALFGVRWTHWVARYWPNLQDPKEVPPWVGRVYERIYHRPFDLEGAGLVFVKDDADMVVLQPEIHLDPEVLLIERIAGGTDLAELPDHAEYHFWLDVLTLDGGEMVYQYRVATNPDGAALLSDHGLPTRFPAVIRHRKQGMARFAWYFAGDFVDTLVELGDPEQAWLVPWRRRVRLGSPEERFFWGWYAPIMQHVLAAEPRRQL